MKNYLSSILTFCLLLVIAPFAHGANKSFKIINNTLTIGSSAMPFQKLARQRYAPTKYKSKRRQHREERREHNMNRSAGN